MAAMVQLQKKKKQKNNSVVVILNGLGAKTNCLAVNRQSQSNSD
jgi:hypothetical protein